MRARRKVSWHGAVNFWPGYVDALTNVVLNLVFMIAIFGTALAVINSMPQSSGTGPGGNGKTPRRVQVTVNGLDGGGVALPGAGAAIGVGPGDAAFGGTRPGAIVQIGPRTAQGAVPAPASVLAAGPGGAFAPSRTQGGMRGAPAEAGSRDRPGLADPTTPPRRAAADVAPELWPVGRQSDLGQKPGGFPYAGLPDGPLSFAVVDAYQRRFMPGVRLVPRPAAGGGQLLTIGLAVGTEPVAALRQPAFRTTLRALLASGPGRERGRVRLWTATRLADPILRRTAYLALIEARSQLLALGYSAAAIEIRLTEGSAATADEKQIYLHAIPATSN